MGKFEAQPNIYPLDADARQRFLRSKLAMRESLFRIFNPSDPMITHTYNPLIKAVQNIDKSNVAETFIKC